jgi:A/G-specific adenine glycosylase
MPWRTKHTPYWVVVSEIMLQQTQVHRVMPKFKAFTKQFPSWQALAAAPLPSVLLAWQGLGYNRRALWLHRCATIIVEKYKGKLPSTLSELTTLPGIGPHTAGAILAYTYNQPTAFVETNIRTVYLHHFFSRANKKVTDAAIYALVERTVDIHQPREWYYALMDYGAHLKKTAGTTNHKSAHYKKQAPFKGSWRQIRAVVLKIALVEKNSAAIIRQASAQNILPLQTRTALKELQDEGFFS